jgi:hypothetical protein
MGRRSVRHQSADQRRHLVPPCAIAFGASLDERYRRRCPSWIAPAAFVLRIPVRPVHIAQRLHIDARTLQLIARLSQSGVTERQRVEPMLRPVVTRLAERRRREDSSWGPPKRFASHVGADGVPQQTPQVPDAARWTRPVAMVLARPTARAVPASSTTAVSVTDGWSGEADAVRRTAVRAGRDTAAVEPQIDVHQLTDRVVAAIERRALSARERLGR